MNADAPRSTASGSDLVSALLSLQLRQVATAR
jgi:hypothetical protein